MPITTEDLIEAGMCLWEACLEHNPKHYQLHRELWGTAETRSRVASFAKSCHLAWEHAHIVLDFDAPFDWEWVPAWLDVCVDEDFDLVAVNVTTQAQMVMERINAEV